ncbi:MAG: radical SAM protein, partial [Adlercreutzia equolifaciens]
MGDRVVVVPKAGADLYLSELEMSGAAPCETSESFSASPADGRTRIGIKVQDGCDNACTYCIVHVARGRATSRPAGEVVAEAVALAESGVREVVLTGINLGSYDDGGTDLTDLCRRLLTATADLYGAASLPPLPHRLHRPGRDWRVRLPRRGRGPHLPPPASACSPVNPGAARDGAPYDAHEFRQLADFLRASVPSIALTTDIIVGFPSETDEDFEDTCALVRHVGFSKIHVFPYSKREGTPAAARADQVPPEVNAARAARLR